MLESMSTEYLVTESVNGNTDAYGEIVTRYQKMVCSVCYSITGDFTTGDDIAQETFITAWKELAKLQSHENLGGWLKGIARNLSLTWIKKQQKDPVAQSNILNSETTAAEEEFTPNLENAREMIWDALEMLPEPSRLTLIMYYRHGKSIKETAASLNETEDCIKQRLVRGRKQLKQQIEKMLEDVLVETTPGPNFSLAVIALLPAVAVTTSGCTVASTVTAGVTGGSKLLIFLYAIVTPILALFSGAFNIWNSIRNQPTLAKRRTTLLGLINNYFLTHLIILILFLQMVIMMGKRSSFYSSPVFWFNWIILVINAFILIRYSWLNYQKRKANIIEHLSIETIHKRVKNNAILFTTVSILLLIITGTSVSSSNKETLIIFSMFTGIWLFYACSIIFIYKWGLKISLNEQTFQENPPLINISDINSYKNLKGKSKFGFICNILWGILGPFMPIMQGLLQNGIDSTVCTLFSVLAGISLITIIKMAKQPKYKIFAFILFYIGCFDAAMISLGYSPIKNTTAKILIAVFYLFAHFLSARFIYKNKFMKNQV